MHKNAVYDETIKLLLFFERATNVNRYFPAEFVEVMRKTVLHERIPFNMESPFIQLYFGRNKQRAISYSEFSQFLHDFHEEYAIEGFRKADKDGTGFISELDFQDIMINIKSHLLTKQVQSHLIEVLRFFPKLSIYF